MCCIILYVFADVYGEKKHNIFKNTRKKNHFINSNSVLSQSPENCWFIPLLPKDLIIGPTASLHYSYCVLIFFSFFQFSNPPSSASRHWSWEVLCCKSHRAAFCRELPPLKTCPSSLCASCFSEGRKRYALGNSVCKTISNGICIL